ncbi:MAG: hypothetical protein MZV70_67345 [Desulfobacterales bacterium]|nr:hypothetical protein [Desulfobacterales bacterium]
MRMSEIHGMAQRGGVVESAPDFRRRPRARSSPTATPTCCMGFEPAETLRALAKCNRNSVAITNLAPLMPFTVNIGQGVYPDLKTAPGPDPLQDRAADRLQRHGAGRARPATSCR